MKVLREKKAVHESILRLFCQAKSTQEAARERRLSNAHKSSHFHCHTVRLWVRLALDNNNRLLQGRPSSEG